MRKPGGPKAVIVFLRKWEKQHAHVQDLDNKATVLRLLVQFYASELQMKNAEAYAAKVFSFKNIHASADCAGLLCDMYRKLGEAQKGVNLINRLQRQKVDFEEWEGELLNSKANCLIDLKKDNEAELCLRKAHELWSSDFAARMNSDIPLLELLLRQKRRPEANELLESIVSEARIVDSHRPQTLKFAYSRISEVMARCDEQSEAIKYLEKAKAVSMEAHDSEHVAMFMQDIGYAYMKLKQYKRALEYFNKCLLEFPHQKWWQKCQALENSENCCEQLKDGKLALSYAERALAAAEGYFSQDFSFGEDSHASDATLAITLICNLLDQDNKKQEADKFLQSQIEKVRAKRNNCLLLAQLHKLEGDRKAAEGKTDEAIECINKHISILNSPELNEQLASRDQNLDDAFYDEAAIYQNAGEFAKAVDELRHALNIPQHSVYSKARDQLLLACNLNNCSNYDEAEKLFQEVRTALKDLPPEEQGILGEQLAIDEELRHKYDLPEEIMIETINLLDKNEMSGSPQMISLLSRLGGTYTADKKYSKAQQALARAVSLLSEPRAKSKLYPPILFKQLENASARKDFAAAERYGKEYLALLPADSRSSGYSILAGVYDSEAKTEEEIAMLEQGLKEMQNSKTTNPKAESSLELGLSKALMNSKRFAEAELHAHKALDLAEQIVQPELVRNFRLANAYFCLGSSQLKNGKTEEAYNNLTDSAQRYENLGKPYLSNLKICLSLLLDAYKSAHKDAAAKVLESKLSKLSSETAPESIP